MKNLADAIESFIIGELLRREHEDALLVQRNELAERLSCAPSQISYVLSTRFTPERGFMVESRRGSGGFVRIMRLAPHTEKLQHEPTAAELVEHMESKKLITARESVLLQYMLKIIDTDEDKKKKVLQQAIGLLGSAKRR